MTKGISCAKLSKTNQGIAIFADDGGSIENAAFEDVLLSANFSKFKVDKCEFCPNGFVDRKEKQDDIVYLIM